MSSRVPGTGAASFDRTAFAEAVDAAVERCTLVTRAQADHFIEKGYVVIRQAFSKSLAREVCAAAWEELGREHGIDRADPDSWARPLGGAMPGYVRTRGSGERFLLRDAASKALQAQADLAGGAARLRDGDALAWNDAAIANLGVADGSAWRPPTPRGAGWHKDGWHFRHFLDSPEQGLLTVPIFSDIAPRSGGTFIATDSIGPVARLLAAHPEGIHADAVQGAGYLIPGLIEQCSRFEELTGEAGDLALLHPFLLHRVAQNNTVRPRFIANVAVVLAAPMRFDRPADDPYSLVELAVLHALRVRRLEFRATAPREAVRPAPFRDGADAAAQRRVLDDEMTAMARAGVVTPDWADAFGYASNRGALARRG